MRVTAENIIYSIMKLKRDVSYDYVNPKTRTKIIVKDIKKPEGPIKILRYNPEKGETPNTAKEESISTQMIWRIANTIVEDKPINFDRILRGSYNTRSALESLLAHTPEFYFSYPGRVETIHSTTEIKRGHKHLIWKPNNPHEIGKIEEISTKIVISEISTEAFYGELDLEEIKKKDTQIDINIQRRHSQIQLALLMIGIQLGSRVSIAKNDMKIIYQGKYIGQMEGVIKEIDRERLLVSYQDAVRIGSFIDVIWFRNDKFMPAVFEIEHTTGVTSGLSRMKSFHDLIPPIRTRYVIVAPDEDRNKVYQESSKEQYKELNVNYFPYSGVEELYSLCQRRRIKGVNDEFLDSFMESA